MRLLPVQSPTGKVGADGTAVTHWNALVSLASTAGTGCGQLRWLARPAVLRTSQSTERCKSKLAVVGTETQSAVGIADSFTEHYPFERQSRQVSPRDVVWSSA